MNTLKIDAEALIGARKQFCLDIGLPWEEYQAHATQKVFIRKAVYREGTLKVNTEGARDYERGNDFFHAIICLGQLFLVVDEQLYDWAVETFSDCSPEWFCEFSNLRMIDEKLKEYGHGIKDTHVYYLPECRLTSGDALMPEVSGSVGKVIAGKKVASEDAGSMPVGEKVVSEDAPQYQWYDREEILKFKENNRFTSAICFSGTQPDMLAVAAFKESVPEENGHAAASEDGDRRCQKPELECQKAAELECQERAELKCQNAAYWRFDQSRMAGMAGVSADGKYLWQIGINVIPEETGRGLAVRLVRMMKEKVLAEGKIPFYGTSESHTVSQTVGLKAGFVPAWTEVYGK